MSDDSVTFPVTVRRQLLLDLLCTAVEGGSGYWAEFSEAERTPDLDYLSVRVTELEASSSDKPRVNRIVKAEELATGLARLSQATFETAWQHLADALSENGDAITADVVLQMTVLGELVYG